MRTYKGPWLFRKPRFHVCEARDFVVCLRTSPRRDLGNIYLSEHYGTSETSRFSRRSSPHLSASRHPAPAPHVVARWNVPAATRRAAPICRAEVVRVYGTRHTLYSQQLEWAHHLPTHVYRGAVARWHLCHRICARHWWYPVYCRAWQWCWGTTRSWRYNHHCIRFVMADWYEWCETSQRQYSKDISNTSVIRCCESRHTISR